MSLPWLACNPRARRDMPYGPAQLAVVDMRHIDNVMATLAACPAHRPTPLHALPALAGRLGLASLHVKDEAQRFGFGAFKALGGVYAVGSILQRIVGEAIGREVAVTALTDGSCRDATRDIVVTTASSGNHGRAVAAGARLFGCRCVIFLPGFTSAEKEAAIRARGAEVIRIDGDYDAAVARCREVAAGKGWIVVSDTSWPGYSDIPRLVLRGYTVLAHELLDQFAAIGTAMPTHVFLQAGVGGLAAAVIGALWQVLQSRRPVFIVVEPQSADCWFQSNRAGGPTLASGDARTAMGGLACREISPDTWPVVGLGADWFMSIPEDAVAPAMRRLARPEPGDPVIVAGPSGCSGMAALLRVAGSATARTELGLSAQSRIVLVNSEGASGEPILFRQATGLTVDEAAAAMHSAQGT
jgi:diaminopropionate ammonia-lyase